MKKSRPKLCSWCNKRTVIDNDPDYNICQECLTKQNQKEQTHKIYKLPGNP